MHLTPAELIRLEQMTEMGQVRSNPGTLSATDRMIDRMMAAAAARRPREAPAAESRPALPPAADGDAVQWDWRIPRTLDELIEIRRALIRDELARPQA